jgi:two-component system chemotaxis response regulator CheB
MIKVLVVEDSKVAAEYLNFILDSDPELQVIGVVSDGKQAVDFVKQIRPDIITMDIDMPVMNGLEATREIMSTNPVPIIVVTSSRNANEKQVSIEALSAGALSVIEKPYGVNHPKEAATVDRLIKMVKLMSDVKVVTHRHLKPNKLKSEITKKHSSNLSWNYKQYDIIAIGVSTGGPAVLKNIFSLITADFPLPIVVVQHITEGFLEGLISWLSEQTSIPVRIAKQNDKLHPGVVYFAPDNKTLGIDVGGIVKLNLPESQNHLYPSVSLLFRSILHTYHKKAIAFLLTGMGSDGARELKELRTAGALTIAQDRDSSIVFGMPGVAIKLDAAELVMNTNDIRDFLTEMEQFHKTGENLKKL